MSQGNETGGDKGAKVLTDEERNVDISEIRLPPEELIDELDNSGQSTSETDAARSEPVAKEAAELDYVDGPEEKIVPLVRPFRLDGRVVDSVRARPLTVAETGRIMQAVSSPDVFDFYAAMTGLPAAVIRGMRGADGETVTEAAFGFLPRFMRGGG